MSQLADVMRRANVFVDGAKYIGKAVYKSPDIKFKTETNESSFVNIDQIIGMESMSTEITFTEYSPEVLKLVNICNGSTVDLVFRGSYETDKCEKRSFKEEMKIKISGIDGSEKKVGKAETKITAIVHSYKLFDNGDLIHDISQEKFVVNGKDQMLDHVNNAGG